MAISFDPLNDTVGKDLSTLILQRRNQGSVGLSVHIALEYPWKTEKKMDVFGFSDKWSCLSTPHLFGSLSPFSEVVLAMSF